MVTFASIEKQYLPGVMGLCKSEGWQSYTEAEITWRALTAPGVCTVVALSEGKVVGFAQMQGDGVVQAHLTLIVVAKERRGGGIGRGLVEHAFARCGGNRVDLITEKGANGFYRSFAHKEWTGFRLYPDAPTDARPDPGT